MTVGPFRKLTDVSNPDILMRAIIRTYERYDQDGLKPGSEHWTSDTSRYRPKMIEDVFQDWSAAVETDKHFPWTDDFIGHCWIAWRKLKSGDKNNMRVSLGLMTLFDDACDDGMMPEPKT